MIREILNFRLFARLYFFLLIAFFVIGSIVSIMGPGFPCSNFLWPIIFSLEVIPGDILNFFDEHKIVLNYWFEVVGLWLVGFGVIPLIFKLLTGTAKQIIKSWKGKV
jgi:hypothetical protein